MACSAVSRSRLIRLDIREAKKNKVTVPINMTAKITLNSFSSDLLRSVRTPLVVSSAITAPITLSSIQIGYAADNITALLSGVSRQDEAGWPLSALDFT